MDDRGFNCECVTWSRRSTIWIIIYLDNYQTTTNSAIIVSVIYPFRKKKYTCFYTLDHLQVATRLYNKKTDIHKYFFWKFPVVPKYSLYASHNLNTLHDTSQFLVCRFEQYRRLCWFKFATSFQFSYKTMSILLFILIKKKKVPRQRHILQIF